jgi:hypothetical protein
MKTNQQLKISFQEIKTYLDNNPLVKRIVYALLAIGAIYLAGKLASGMASAVRGFSNLGSALRGH